MPTWTAGNEGEGVATIQRYIVAQFKALNMTLPREFVVNGVWNAATIAAVKRWQTRMKIPVTGNWDGYSNKKAIDVERFTTGGKSSDPFSGTRTSQTIARDRKFVHDEFVRMYGRPPTETESIYRVNQLQSGMGKDRWVAGMERKDAVASITRIFQEQLGREPSASELARWKKQMEDGKLTRVSLTKYLANSHEGLTRTREDALAPGAEDQRVIMEDLLDRYGMGDLKEWAWEQITSGVSNERMMQNLRQTDSYKTRFAGMEARRAAGLPAIDETDYLNYERNARSLMQRNGFPPSFFDEPADYVALIAADISVEELGARISEGYMRVTQAPIEIRQAFAELYGTDGDAALAALYIDPDRAEAALLKQTRTAETKGWGGLFGVDYSAPEAERVADINLSPDQLRQGLGQLQEAAPLFSETVSETDDLTAAREGSEAVFGLGGTGATDIERRRLTRIAATSGGGGANINTEGVGVGAAN